jgi:hypothetical protein
MTNESSDDEVYPGYDDGPIEDFDLLLVPLDERVEYSRGIYTASKHMTLSEGLTACMAGSPDLLAEIRKHRCDHYFLEYLCAMDRKFAGKICIQGNLLVALRDLKGADASGLYSFGPDQIPLDVLRNDRGQLALHYVSSAFDNRVAVIKGRMRFLELLFEHLVQQDVAVFNANEYELKELLVDLRDEMDAFHAQLPTVAPKKIGGFKYQRQLTGQLLIKHQELVEDVKAACARAREVVAEAQQRAAEGGGGFFAGAAA